MRCIANRDSLCEGERLTAAAALVFFKACAIGTFGNTGMRFMLGNLDVIQCTVIFIFRMEAAFINNTADAMICGLIHSDIPP